MGLFVLRRLEGAGRGEGVLLREADRETGKPEPFSWESNTPGYQTMPNYLPQFPPFSSLFSPLKDLLLLLVSIVLHRSH